MRKQARPDIRFLQQEGPERRRVLLLIPRTQAMHSNLFRPTQWTQESTQVLEQQFGDFKGSEMPTMRHLSPARVNACVNLRRNNFDPPVIFVPTLTISRVLSYVCSAPERITNATTPPCGRSSPPGHAVVDGW